jgi:hypothetical protein
MKSRTRTFRTNNQPNGERGRGKGKGERGKERERIISFLQFFIIYDNIKDVFTIDNLVDILYRLINEIDLFPY